MLGSLKPISTLASVCLTVLSVSGCVSVGGGQAQTSLLPPAAGGAALALLEPLGGGLIGQIDSVRLPRADRIEALQSEYRALEYTPPGDVVSWRGRDGGVSGQVVASQPYRVGSQDCRQYTQAVMAGAADAPVTARGTACRNPDGSWELLS